MSRDALGTCFARPLLVWAAVGALTGGVLTMLGPDLRNAAALTAPDALARTPFTDLLVAVGATVLALCALWFWVLSTLVVAEAVGAAGPWPRGCPTGLRRLLLVACGVAVVVGSGPAVAGTDRSVRAEAPDRTVVAGLSVPDRPFGGAGAGPATATAAGPAAADTSDAPDTSDASRAVVTAGDSLWGIAASTLPAGATAAAVDRRWRQLWRVNRAVIGPDPHLIHPGTVLDLTDQKES